MSEDLFGGLIGSPTTAAPATTGGSLADANRAGDATTTAAGCRWPVRMRPRTLDEIVGQQHLLAPGSPLRRLAAGEPMSVFLWGPPGVGKTTIAVGGVAADRLEVRRDLRGHRRGQGGPGRARPGPPRSADRPADRAVRRRGAPVLQDPAGRAAAGGGEPAGHPDRRHHREPELLGHLAAAVALPAAHPAAADRRRHLRPAGPRAGRRARTARARTMLDDGGPGQPAAARRRRRPPGADLPGGVGGRGRARSAGRR